MPRILERAGRLYISGSFPKKNGQPGNAQTLVTLQLDDTPAGRKQAEKWLKKAERDLKADRWDWADWQRTKHKGQTGTWQEAIRSLRRRKVELGKTSPSTWHVNYWGSLKLMPLQAKVSTESIAQELGRYSRDQYTYKKLFYLLRDIASIAGVPFPEVGVPTYNNKNNQTDVPADSEIIDWVLSAPQPHRWYFGMMATYGLRPHECDECRMLTSQQGLLLVQVDDVTKTGYRTVIPQETAWVELFGLHDRQQRPESDRDADRNDTTSVWLNRWRLKQKLPWKPYSLRHAFAGRLWRNGGAELDVFDAAQLMGHSQKEHIETYRRWIDPAKIAVSALAAIERNQTKVRAQLKESLDRDDRVDVDA